MMLTRSARVPAALPLGALLAEARGVSASLGGVEILHTIDLAVHAGDAGG